MKREETLEQKEKEILVSIVTPSYNQAEFIEDTILSIQNQTYPFVEHIIVDGASTDGTVEILKKYGDNINWISEPDNGETEAVNKGFKMARGEIIGWVSSDNTLELDAVETVVSIFKHHPDIDMVSGGANIIDKNGKLLEVIRPPAIFSLRGLILKTGAYGMYEPATFIKKNVLKEVGMLDSSMKYAIDLDLFIRIGMKYKVEHVPHILANVRYHPEATTLRKSKEQRAEVRILGKKYLEPSIANFIFLKYFGLKRFLSYSMREKGVYHILQKFRQKIRKI